MLGKETILWVDFSSKVIVSTNKICQCFYRNGWYHTCKKGDEPHKTYPKILPLRHTRNSLDNLIRIDTSCLVLVPIPTIIGMVSFICTRVSQSKSCSGWFQLRFQFLEKKTHNLRLLPSLISHLYRQLKLCHDPAIVSKLVSKWVSDIKPCHICNAVTFTEVWYIGILFHVIYFSSQFTLPTSCNYY
jgi:hypothetical protein